MADTSFTTSMTIGGIVFDPIQTPKALPVPTVRGRSVEHYMRNGASGPGIRVIQFIGSHPSYDDVSFKLFKVTSNQLASLEVLFRAQAPFVWLIDLNNGSTWSYRVTFADDGLVPSLPALAGYDANAYHVDLKFRIMENLT